MYGACKVYKTSVENCLLFLPVFLALGTPIYKLAKFLEPILKSLTTNKFTVKNYFHFAEEIIDQQPDFFLSSLDVDSLFTIPYLRFYQWRSLKLAQKNLKPLKA